MITLTLLWLLGCNGCSPAEAPVRSVVGKEPDILLIVVDSLRADHMSAYGYGRKTTPGLDAWAEDAVVFERAYSHAASTRPAMASLLLSKLPAQHGLHTGKDEPHGATPPLQRVLAGEGYMTGAVISSPALRVDKNPFMAGFARVDVSALRGEEPVYKRPVAEGVTDAAIAMWKGYQGSNRKGPLFLMVHYLDPHQPYLDHEGVPSGKSPRGKYDGEIRYVDGQVTRLLEAVGRDVLVVFTADHGEALGDHGKGGHGETLYEEEVRVPLIVKAPGVKRGRVKKAVAHLDVAPGILTLAGVAVPKAFSGGGWTIDPFGGVDVAKKPIVLDTREGADKRAVVSGNLKLVRDFQADTWELFDLEEDPQEKDNRVADPKMADELGRLRQVLER